MCSRWARTRPSRCSSPSRASARSPTCSRPVTMPSAAWPPTGTPSSTRGCSNCSPGSPISSPRAARRPAPTSMRRPPGARTADGGRRGGTLTVERPMIDRLERRIDREVKARFGPGVVRRVTLLQHDDDAAIEPGDLLVRVVIEAAGGPEDYQRSLDEWAQAHQTGMKRLRRELSLRLPPARLLEFTVDDRGGGVATPRITMPDDPVLTAEPLPTREIVETALSLLRASYIFPDRAGQAAAAIEARLAAGEYEGLDEATLAE